MKKFDDFIEYIGKITTNKITFDQLYDMYDIYTAVSKEDGRNRFEVMGFLHWNRFAFTLPERRTFVNRMP